METLPGWWESEQLTSQSRHQLTGGSQSQGSTGGHQHTLRRTGGEEIPTHPSGHFSSWTTSKTSINGEESSPPVFEEGGVIDR